MPAVQNDVAQRGLEVSNETVDAPVPVAPDSDTTAWVALTPTAADPLVKLTVIHGQRPHLCAHF